MAAALPDDQNGVIGDLAVGGGALLDAAEDRFGSRRQYFATDVDPTVTEALSRSRAYWHIGRADLLSSASPKMSCRHDDACPQPTQLLLNPPFSYRGNRGFHSTLRGDELRSSRALACVISALDRSPMALAAVVLLPRSVLTSEIDKRAREAVRAVYSLELLAEYGRGTFAGTNASTVLVRLTQEPGVRRQASLEAVIPPFVRKATQSVELYRGTTPVHLSDSGSSPPVEFIHSDNLRGGKVAKASRRTTRGRRIRGPAVLLPRVGRPAVDKIAVLDRADEVVLSDCIFALKSSTLGPDELRARIVENYSLLEGSYGGSCAPYITRVRLEHFLSTVGLVPKTWS
ncbi:hypothetical protein Dac01nite_20880 [Demequina activiva]|uniref:DNA methylase adenine-specific domain-containing protein n=1 Tax=Demequina activiva TaxID=1582364 RepID=A0A919Q3W1_9MICO|nr:hypothetical protein Dac01nite_20880 [Demequina activiva]